jgi:hypothetical protein
MLSSKRGRLPAIDKEGLQDRADTSWVKDPTAGPKKASNVLVKSSSHSPVAFGHHVWWGQPNLKRKTYHECRTV